MDIEGKGAYGLVFQEVTRNENIRPAAKGLYAYLSSFCGEKDECYPSAKLIAKEMGMGKTAFHNAMNELIAAGVVVKCQLKGESGKFGRNTYKLTHNVYFTEKPCTDNRYTDNPYTVLRSPDIGTTNNNNINSNNTINNNSKNNVNQMSTKCQPSDIPSIGKDSIGKYNITISKDIVSKKQGNIHTQNQPREEIPYQQIVDMFNSICISFPRVTKLSEARRKAIRARYNQYSTEDFERLFGMAEGSSFLKGSNDRNWSASFDWLIADKNMAKVLDGNYMDRQGEKNTGQAQPRKAYKQFNEREYDRKQMDDLERMLLNK